MARTAMLAVAVASIAGFLYLTIYAAADRGFTVLTVVSVLIVLLLGIGIVGALLERPPDDE
jgi:hypothetical protein